MKPTKKPHMFKTNKNLSSTPTWLFLFNSLCLIIFLCCGVNCHSHTEQDLRMLNKPDWEFGAIRRFPYIVHLPQSVWDLFWATLLV